MHMFLGQSIPFRVMDISEVHFKIAHFVSQLFMFFTTLIFMVFFMFDKFSTLTPAVSGTFLLILCFTPDIQSKLTVALIGIWIAC